MNHWIRSLRQALVEPQRHWHWLAALLAIALVWEFQYALRYMYLVPVWDIAALQEMLLYRMESQPDRSVWDVAINFVVNGHWPLIPFFAYYVDFAHDSASGRLPMVISWLALLAMAPALAWVLRDRGSPVAVLAGLAVAVVMFWPAQMETVISPMQVLISLSLLFGMLALRSSTGDVSLRRLVLTVLLALASMFSFGYGVVLWPCIALLLVIERRWRSALAIAGIGVVSLWIYQHGAVGSGFNPLRALVQSPVEVLGYSLAQAGAFFAYLVQQATPLVAQIAGGVALVAQLALSVLLWRSGRWRERALRFLWLLGLWLIGMMLLTGLGRYSLGPTQAMNTRYLIVSSLYWLSLFLLAWRLADASRRSRCLIGGIGAATLLVLLASVPWYVERMQAVRINQRVAALALTLGITEVNQQNQPNTVLHPWSLTKLYAYLRAQRMTIYREAWSTWLGGSYSTRFGNAVPRRCEFALDSRTPMPGGQRWIGWMHSPATAASPDEVLFVAGDIIVGMGFMLIERPEIAAHFASPAALHSGYYGFLPTQPAGEIVVYGLFSDGSTCRAGSLPAV